jgi:truncated hemoglobin YjbI
MYLKIKTTIFIGITDRLLAQIATSINKIFDIIDYFYQQMHQDKFVTVFFSERVPQYAFRQLYCHHQGFF